VAKYGAKVFYEGEIGLSHVSSFPRIQLKYLANQTISALRAANGTMTLSDLANYNVSIRPAIHITYRNYSLYSTGVPSGGSVALSILKIIEGYNMSSPSDIAVNLHRLDEAMRFSYASRGELGDPDYFGYMVGLEANMLKAKTAEAIRGRIDDDKTHNASYYSPNQYMQPKNHGTSHIVATDASGMSISLTSTVNLLFGSQIVVPETG
jgi:gamma-glutamyltranspeptidase/glutathione hydrolase